MINRKEGKRQKKALRRMLAKKDSGAGGAPQDAIPFLASRPSLKPSENLYDRVLVDAECTHDGSLRHILKYNVAGWDGLEENFLEPTRLATLTALQRGLLLNGLRLLKPGGTLVYSTCSFSKAQNEDVVSWLLETVKDEVELIPVDRTLLPDDSCYSTLTSGENDPLRRTVRFNPSLHATSGLFVAKFRKAGQSDAGDNSPPPTKRPRSEETE